MNNILKLGLSRLFFVVILALVILAIVILFTPLDGRDQCSVARTKVAKADIKSLSMTLERHKLDNDEYPTTEQGLRALLEKPIIPPIPKDWQGPYCFPEGLIDPWGNPYQYRCPSQHNRPDFDIWSFGRDGKDGTEDDITNWSPYPEEAYTSKRMLDYIIDYSDYIIIISVIVICLLLRDTIKGKG